MHKFFLLQRKHRFGDHFYSASTMYAARRRNWIPLLAFVSLGVWTLSLFQWLDKRIFFRTNNNDALPQGKENSELPANTPLIFYDSDIIERSDYWAGRSADKTGSNVLQVVSHRELLIGCHSFQEYLSPRFHTVLVFPKKFVEIMDLGQLVSSATADQTAGVHLFVTNSWAGSNLARRIGEQFAREELGPRGLDIQFMNSINCDVHELPVGHRHYSSLENVTLKLAKDFEVARRERQEKNDLSIVDNYNDKGYPADENGTCTHFCSSPVPHKRMAILAMNTILFEDIPDMENLENFHGHDTGKWWESGGWDNRPQHLGAFPWLRDESNFFEDHMIMFDLQQLQHIRDVYFAVSPLTFPDENNFLGVLANQNNMTVVRNNDIVLHLNFGHTQVPFPGHVNLELIKLLNFELLGMYRNPRFLSGNWERASSMAGVETDHQPFIIFALKHCRKDVWLPANWTETSLVSDFATVVDSYLSYFGYTRVSSSTSPALRYALDGIHLPTRLIKNSGSGRRLFKLKRPWSNFLVDRLEEGPPNEVHERVLEIPLTAILSRKNFYVCKD